MDALAAEIDSDLATYASTDSDEFDLPAGSKSLFSCCYEEAPASEDFFVPLAWSQAVKGDIIISSTRVLTLIHFCVFLLNSCSRDSMEC